ncbi:exonuclease I [Thioflavicoccus mobilis 8321]|uniref:Exodeoxyribonuclease I n=1 Tax=Thioflavicoccus mobilis 8321 TaxID=765912 RepID=L0GZX6_9GAMM|nr:exodeoxyribonuclease I [Thioflavicoccus mobilis]AGA90879.1 exonuclease I [Thioflavicoccus mobilis 8321]
MIETFYWHDYETWGADPWRDRPAQFAGQRTDVDLNPIDEPLVLYCRPATDLLPQPEACLITGITPQLAWRDGLIEAEFAAAIERVLVQPGTCGAGYNSLRFDDEVTRHLLYRNLFDPYAREWRNGNSRWDLIDVLRAAHALRPAGIEWPKRDDGTASFRLEDLTAANGIEHGAAHDALADVRATIALVRRLKQAQPKLFDYALRLRDKRVALRMLAEGRPLLHVSARYPAERGCIAPVLPIAHHPTNANGVIVFDLREDPAAFADLSVEALRERLFTPAAERAGDVAPIPVKTVRVNHAPFLAPLATLTPEAAERWAADLDRVRRHAGATDALKALGERLVQVYGRPMRGPPSDPDLMLYSGGFIGDADRRVLDRLRRLAPEDLAVERPTFEDPRLPEMLWRYRARNWPETLTDAEREDWDAYRLARLADPEAGGSIVIDAFEQRLIDLRATCTDAPAKLAVIDELAAWAEQVMDVGD